MFDTTQPCIVFRHFNNKQQLLKYQHCDLTTYQINEIKQDHDT